MQEIKLNRTGKRPVVFIGKELVLVTSRKEGDSRWVKAQVFETDRQTFVVGIARIYMGSYDDYYNAHELDSMEQVVTFLEGAAPEIAGIIAKHLGVSEVL